MGPSVPMEASDGDPGNVAFKLELKGATQADLETKFAELGIPAGSTLTLEGIVAQKVGDAEGAPDLGVEAEHWDALFRYRCKDNKRMGCQLHLGYPPLEPLEPVVSSVCKPVPAALIVTCGGSGSPAHFLTPRFNLEMSLSDLCTMLVRAADRPECCRMYALSPSHASESARIVSIGYSYLFKKFLYLALLCPQKQEGTWKCFVMHIARMALWYLQIRSQKLLPKKWEMPYAKSDQQGRTQRG